MQTVTFVGGPKPEPVPAVEPTTWQPPQRRAADDDGVGFDFWDFLDIINPLQHIPIVSSVYRAVTGDEIGPVARLVGAGLYGFGLLGGGVLSVASAAANIAIEEATGNDILGHVIDLVDGDGAGGSGGEGGAGGAGEALASADEAAALVAGRSAAPPAPAPTPRAPQTALSQAFAGDEGEAAPTRTTVQGGQVNLQPSVLSALLAANAVDLPAAAGGTQAQVGMSLNGVVRQVGNGVAMTVGGQVRSGAMQAAAVN